MHPDFGMEVGLQLQPTSTLVSALRSQVDKLAILAYADDRDGNGICDMVAT